MLIIDYEINQIIQEIQTHCERMGHGRVEYDTIVKVIESQTEGLIAGMAGGYEVYFPYFGRFCASKRRVDALNRKYEQIGKVAGLVDRGVYRMSFLKNGKNLGETPIDQTGSAMLDVPEKYRTNDRPTD